MSKENKLPTRPEIERVIRRALLAKELLKGMEETGYLSVYRAACVTVAYQILTECIEDLSGIDSLDLADLPIERREDPSDLPF